MKDPNSIKISQKQALIFQKPKEWKDAIMNVSQEMSKNVPVILALKNKDFNTLSGAFKKHHVVNLQATCKAKNYGELHAIIEKQFPQRNNEGKYGIYALTDDLARGLDFPSTYQIEEAGGIFLLLCDVFPTTSQQQFKGRIGRLKNKGQW